MEKKKQYQVLFFSGTSFFTNCKKKVCSWYLFFAIFLLHFSYKACSPLNVPTIATQTIIGTNLIITVNGSSTWLNCADVIDLEISCSAGSFSGLASNTFTSPPQSFPSTPYTYATQTINIASLCPGTAYNFRIRERNSGGATASNWSFTYTFTTLGVFVLPILGLASNPNLICPPQNVQLNAGIIGGCGLGNYSYTWFPTAGLSNPNIANPVATVTSATTYTCFVTGGPTGCWSISGTYFLNSGVGPPIPGLASANPSNICVSQTSTISLSTYTGFPQWQSAPSPSGPWTSIPGATNPVYNTPALGSTTYFQALISSCIGASITTNVVAVTTNTVPTLIPVTGCTGTLSQLSFSSIGTSGMPGSVIWSPAPISQNGPGTSATYSVPGTVYAIAIFTDGCIGSTSFNVTTPTLSLNTASINCNSLGSATVTPINMFGPYTYTWIPTLQTNSIATGLFPGIYTISVGFGNGNCINTTTTNFVALTPFTGTVQNTDSLKCQSVPSGTASINLGGGTGFQTYLWANSTGTQSSATAIGLTAGISTVTVIDAVTFCSVTKTFQIFAPPPLNFSISASSPTNCTGKNISFTVAGSGGITGPAGYTYTWVAGPVSNTNLVNEAIGGTYIYSVSGEDAYHCLASSTIAVDFISNPVLSVANISICPLEIGILNVSGANTYTWNGAFSGTSFTANPSSNTTYSVVGSALGCTSTALAVVFMKPVPFPFLSSNSPICNGTNLHLNAIGGVAYSWTGPLSYVSGVQNAVINAITPANSGIYQSIVTGANSCTASAIISVTINPTPTLLVNNSNVCVTQTLNLSALSIPGSTFLWTGPASFTSSLQSPGIVNPALNTGGNYTVKVTSAAGCTNTAIAGVTVVALPIPLITSNSPRCYGDNLILGGSGGVSYIWNGPNGFNVAAQNPTLASVTLPADGIYTLIVTTGPCAAVITKSVTIYPLPAPIASNNGDSLPLCDTKTLYLYANTSGTNYVWSGPLGFTSQLQNPIPITFITPGRSGIYTVSVIDIHSCRASASTTVTVLNNPVVTVQSTTVCLNEPALLNASGAVSYTWTGPNFFNSNQQNAYIATATNTAVTVYTLTGSAANQCTSIREGSVTTMMLPIPYLTVFPKTEVCLNSTLYLEGGGGVSYEWNTPDDFLFAGKTLSFTADNMNFAGTYSVIVSDARGCKSVTTTVISLNALPLGGLDGTMSGCAPFLSNFSFSSLSTSPHVTPQWQINNDSIIHRKNFSYYFKESGDYLIHAFFKDTVTGCMNTFSYVVNAHPQPIADFTFSPNNPVEYTDNVFFENSSQGEQINTWRWFLQGDNSEFSFEKNISHIFMEAGIYPVAMVVTNSWGCSDTSIKAVKVDPDFSVFVPNAFTPNEDQINPVFLPVLRGVKFYEMLIFNRWGNKIFETHDPLTGWDGSLNGEACENDTYVWKIKASGYRDESKDFSGHVTLFR